MNITESLIKEYLVETYISKAAQNPADQAAAEKAFKVELSNGPEQMVWYGSQKFPKKVGSFDLDNFHKAYDKWFDDNNLLDIFTDDGKLVNRGTYARFKDLDKKKPAVKALGQLWGAQFKGDLEFLDDKLARVKAEEDKAAAKAKLEQDREDCKTRFNDPQSLDKVTSTKEWKEMVDVYPAEDRVNIKPVVTVYFESNSAVPEEVVLQIEGIIHPPVDDPHFGRIIIDCKNLSEQDIIKQLTDQKAIADMLVGIKRVYPAAMLMINNYEEYKKRPESQIGILDCRDSHEWLVYYNRDNNKYYRAVRKVFPYNGSSKLGLMLIDINDGNRAGRLTASCILVAARTDYYSTSSNCYTSDSYNDYYNSLFVSDAVAAELGIETKPRQGKGNCDYDINIVDGSNFKLKELTKFFNKKSHYYYDCDTGD